MSRDSTSPSATTPTPSVSAICCSSPASRPSTSTSTSSAETTWPPRPASSSRTWIRILEAAGASFADILKVTVYLTDVNDRQAVNVVRQEFFGDARPASTLIGIAELVVPGMKIEVDAVAGIPS